MSPVPPLPADVGQWPSDPYVLLGVSRRAAPNDVHAAHDRLAAAFDPAGAPEQCRRLGAARDAVLRDLDLQLLLEMPLTLQRQPDLDLSPPHAEPPSLFEPPAPAAEDTVLGLWQMALSGREAEAYRGLIALLQPGAATEDVCLRLYWLLTALPQFDRERSPCDWLVRGLQVTGLAGPLWELYRRALADQARESLSARCTRLLEMAAPSDALVELVRCRWRAAGRAQQWDMLTADLQALRQRLPASERLTWAQLWAAALDQLAWSDARPARDLAGRYLLLLSELPSDPPQVTEVRKRETLLRDLVAGWRQLRPARDVPPALLDLIPASWCDPFPEVRPKLLAFLAEALREPRSFLRALDAMAAQPAVLTQFAGLLEQLRQTLPPAPLEARSSSDLAELIFDFLDTSDRSHHRGLRPLLLEFCLREAIAPETVAELTDEHPNYWHASGGHLSAMVGNDEPLRLAYLAHRLFWM